MNRNNFLGLRYSLKRLLSLMLAFLLVCTMFVALNTSFVKATGEYISILNGFENSSSVDQMQPAEYTVYFNQTVETDIANYATGIQGAKIVLNQASTNDGLGKVIWSTGSGINISEATYIQFYTKNSGSVPISFYNFGFDCFVVTADNYDETNDPAFWSQHIGALYYASQHDFSTYSAQVYLGSTWNTASRTPVTGFTSSGITIPAGFNGLVRIPLASSEKVSASRGFGFMLATKDSGAAGLELAIDDFAIVTTNDKSSDSNYTTLDNYLIKINDEGPKYVKTIANFDTSGGVSQLQPAEYTTFFNQTVSADTTDYAKGTQGAKITLANASTTVGLGKMVWNTGAAVDISDADYIMFYTKNKGSVPLSIYSMSFNAFVVTSGNVNQTNDPTFWSQHLGALYYVYQHNFGVYPAEYYDGGSWVSASKDPVTGFTESAITIPSGFEGLIRIQLAASEKVSNSNGFGFQFVTKDANAAGLVLSLDEFAKVKKAGKGANENFSPFISYLGSLSAPVAQYINTIGDFETAGKIDDLRSQEYKFFNPTISGSSTKFSTGTQGLKMVMGTATDNINRFYYYNGAAINFTNAKYFLYYVKNNGDIPMGVVSMGFNASIGSNPDDTNASVVGFNSHNFSSYPAQLYSGMKWINAPTTDSNLSGIKNDNNVTTPAYVIPAGYEGFVRIPLASSEQISSSTGISFTIGTGKMDEVAGLELYIDDFSLLGTAPSYSDVPLERYYDLSNSLFNWANGDSDNYDYSSDTFYNQNTIYATWVNIWNGSTEAWWNANDTEGIKVLVNGTWQSIDMNNSVHRTQFFNDMKDAGIDVLVMDLTNGSQGWLSQSRDFQRMCNENGMKFCVAINAPDGVTQFEESCAFIWNNYAKPGLDYSDSYMYKDGKPFIVFYTWSANYTAGYSSTGEYRRKFNLAWASGEDSQINKWGWQIVPTDGPMASTDSMFTTMSIDWNSPNGNQDSWRKSLAMIDFCMLAARQNDPKFIIVGSFDDVFERNGWMKADTTNATYRGRKMTDIYGNISTDAYYNRVYDWIINGTASTYNASGIIPDGAYTITNVYSNKKFGVIRPSAGLADDIDTNVKLNYNVSTSMETYYWFYHLGSNEYRIIKLTSGLSLNASGTYVIQSWDANNSNQIWKLETVSGKYVLVNKGTGKALNVSSTTNGTNLNLVTKNTSSTRQQFTITAVPNRTLS